jgi:hypothetical protein
MPETPAGRGRFNVYKGWMKTVYFRPLAVETGEQ